MTASEYGPPGLYQTLPSPRHIRLLEILDNDGLADTKVHLKMYPADIESHDLHYNALSYTWGSPIATPECEALYSSAHDVQATVIVEGRSVSISIGRNLSEALVHVHKQGFKAPLWVDALCINQAHMEEKSHQVQMMALIYGRASMVIAWLGLDDPDLPTLSHIAWIHKELPPVLQEPGEERAWLQKCQFRELKPADPGDGMELRRSDERSLAISRETMKALYRFYQRRRYFTRVWIMQELALAKRVTVLFDDESLSLDFSVDVAVQLNSRPDLKSLYLDSLDPDQADGSELLWFGMLRGMKDALANIPQELVAKQDPDVTTKDAVAVVGFVLCAGNIRGCTNPRDALYSYIGMLSAMRLHEYISLQVDYSIDTGELYTNLMKQLLLLGTSNDALSLATDDPRCPSKYSLPTWVPDFSRNRQGSLISHQILVTSGNFPSFHACRNHYKLPVQIDGPRLYLHGRRCSRILTIIPPNFLPQRTSKPWLNLARSSVAGAVALLEFCVTLGPTYPTGEGIIAAFLQTFRFDTPVHDTEKYTNLVRHFRAWCTVLACCDDEAAITKDDLEILHSLSRFRTALQELSSQPEIPSPEEVEWFRRAQADDYDLSDAETDDALKMAIDSQLFVDDFLLGHWFSMEHGYMGRCVRVEPETDEVWLICDASTPFILRPLPGKAKHYQLVNEAFIHGAMYGELVDESVAGDVEEIVLV